jgi:hypothetical protein
MAKLDFGRIPNILQQAWANVQPLLASLFNL